MRPNINEMKAKRWALSDQMIAMARGPNGRDVKAMSEAEFNRFEAIEAQVKDLDLDIRQAEREQARQAALSRPIGGGGVDYSADDFDTVGRGQQFVDQAGRAFRAYTKNDRLSSSFGHAEPGTFGTMIRAIATGNLHGVTPEIRATMERGVNTAGGFTLDEDLAAGVIDMIRSKNRVIQAGAETVNITGHSLRFVTVTKDPEPQFRNEGAPAAFNESTFGTFSMAPKSAAVIVPFTEELLEDSALNIESVVKRQLSEAFARKIDLVALYGSGVSPEPRGLMNWPGVPEIEATDANGDLPTYGKFSDAYYRLIANDAPENAVSAIYHPHVAARIDRLVDNTGQPLQAPRSFGLISHYTTTAVKRDEEQGTLPTATRIFMGDFSNMLIGMRKTLTFQISREAAALVDAAGGGDPKVVSAFRNFQIWLRASIRFDVAVIRPGQFIMTTGIAS